MPIDVKSIRSLLGDRLLVKPLSRPEKRGTLFVPQSALKEKGKQYEIWWAEVEALGRDAKYPDAYGVTVGDIVGIEFIGRQCETLTDGNGDEHCWVAEEFLAAKDNGRVAAFHAGKPHGDTPMIQPLGAYILVRPEPEEEKRGGIHLPHNAREPQKFGEVLSVSIGELNGRELDCLPVEVGNRVLFGRFSGSWVKLDEDLLMMKCGSAAQGDVLAVVDSAKEAASV
jgi:chaperonin GroES